MQVFSKDWFTQHRTKLVRFANTGIGRHVLEIDDDRPIDDLAPNMVSFRVDDQTSQARFYTNDVVARNLYRKLKPFWYAVHLWDIGIANNLNPSLNAGFDTLTVYPDANPETTSVDGWMYQGQYSQDLNTLVTAAGNYVDDSSTLITAPYMVANWSNSNKWDVVGRGMLLFDTSSLGVSANISAAAINLKFTGRSDPFTSSLVIVSANPTSNTSLATSDFVYTKFGTTSFNTTAFSAVTLGGSSYTTLTLNASGRSNISKTGVSKFGIRSLDDINNQLSATSPTWSAGASSYLSFYSAEKGTTYRPYLEVTYIRGYDTTVGGTLLFSGTAISTTQHVLTLSGSLLFSGGVTPQKVISVLPGRDYIYRVYDKNGTYITTWKDVASELSYSLRINSAGATVDVELARNSDSRDEVRDALVTDASEAIVTDASEAYSVTAQGSARIGTGTDVDVNLRVDIYVVYGGFETLVTESGVEIVDEDGESYIVSDGAPMGRRVFSGFIMDYEANYGEKSNVNVRLVSHAYELSNAVVTSGSNTTVTYSSQDYGTILRSIIAAYAGTISYTTSTIDLVGSSTSQTFRLNTVYEAIQALYRQSPAGWYFYVDVADNLLYFKNTGSTADHTFTLGKHIKSLKLSKSIENLVNTYYFIGGETAGTPLYKKYTDATSISTYRTGLERVTERTITDAGTAALLSTKAFDLYADPVYTTTVEIAAEAYPIEEVGIGEIVTFAGFDNFIDGLNFQVVGLTYTEKYIRLELGAVLPSQYELIAKLNKTIVDEAQANLPNAPS